MQSERQLQESVKYCLINELHYKFLGSRENINNSPVIRELLAKNLASRNYAPEVISRAVDDLDNAAKNQTDTLYNINEKIYMLLRYGDQGLKDSSGDKITVNYIDWVKIANNDFYVAEEVSIICRDGKRRKRPDLVIYVNGIAIGVIELKNSRVSVNEGIRQLITNQQREYIQTFFSTTQILMAGNASQGLRYGTVNTAEKYYLTWHEDMNAKDSLSLSVQEMQAQEKNLLRDGIISLCHHERLLNLIHDFIIFDAGVKKIARHNQYFAVIAAQSRIKQHEGGIIWNTQGSGKSLIMVWLTRWIREHIDDSRVVIITDREELDDQIKGTFSDVGEENVTRAQSGRHLRAILNRHEDFIICSLIHKYGHKAGKQSDIDLYTEELLRNLPKNFEAKGNIIAFIDECHRTNSGKLHRAVKTLMPRAILIGFTGTPLLKSDKPTSLQTFGSYIHTYKFNEAVSDGVIVDLRYEARDVDQFLSSPDKIDAFFEARTKELTEIAREKLKRSWATLQKLYSSSERLTRIAADIISDMTLKPRLASERGNAILVANSVYEACRYWEIFQANNFTKCAVITSFIPTVKKTRTAKSDISQDSTEEYKNKIYDRMLCGKNVQEFEEAAKNLFTDTPAQMKLLIVVDKLLTGFDAPHATYLYIDKSMRDHDLFQAICRVNRIDGSDKDFGYIVDYMDLFKNIESAVKDYTSNAFDLYDKNDVEGLIKNFSDEAEAELRGSLNSLRDLLSGVKEPRTDLSYMEFFCNDERISEREILYKLVASVTRSFANCCERLISHYKYTSEGVNKIREDIREYNELKELIKMSSCDYIDLKAYEADMRYILDTYIHAEDSRVVSSLSDMSLVELLVDGKNLTPDEVLDGIKCDDPAKAELIENNIYHEIVLKADTNKIYYGKLSEMLKSLINRRKNESLDYSEYLREIIELARKVIHPESDSNYPDSIRDSAARRAIYDYLGGDSDLAVELDEIIQKSIRSGYKNNQTKSKIVCRNIKRVLIKNGIDSDKAEEMTDKIFELVKLQPEYDKK